MGELDELRRRIDAVDAEILDLLNRRARLAQEVGRLKSRDNQNFHDPARELEILDALERRNRGPFPNHAVRAVFREIMSASLALECPITVAYLGPQATFTHLVCMKHFGGSARYLPVKSIREVFEAVEREHAHYGVVPVENSTEGVVSHTLDMFLDSDLKITAEILLEVSHHLMSLSGEVARVRRVYSHPQAAAQCRRWLEEHLPGVPVVDTESTARAAERAAGEPEAAAVASEAAVRIYGLRVIQPRIEDNPHNTTRFLAVAREMAEPTGRDKTSVVFSFKNQPGGLFNALRPFAEKGINLTKIESRPTKKKAWEYVFYVDLEGHVQDAGVREALEELRESAFFVKVLGSYPRART